MGRWEELMNEVPTDNSKIDWYPGCKGCMFVEDDGTGTAYRKAVCIMFGDPHGKPGGLSDGSVKCPYYEREGESNDEIVADAGESNRHERIPRRQRP